MQANSCDHDLSERINKLLIKCIDFRSKIGSLDVSTVQNFERKEETLKNALFAKYEELKCIQKEALIKVELFIEETFQSCNEPRIFTCNPKWTVRSAKQVFIKEFDINLPLENIFVLCQDKIADEWTTLEQCGISKNGDVLYIYLVKDKLQDIDKSVNQIDSLEEINHMMHRLNLLDSDLTKNSVLMTSMHSNLSVHEQGETVLETLLQTPENENNTVDIALFKEVKPVFQSISNAVEDNLGESTAISNEQAAQSPPKNIDENVAAGTDASSKEHFGWECSQCTFINEPTRPGCSVCSSSRPLNYQPPTDYVPSSDERDRIEKEKESELKVIKMQEEMQHIKEEIRIKNYQDHLSVHEQSILENSEPVDCSICLTEAGMGEAVILAECLHIFCKECLCMHIMLSDQLPVTCPFVDDNYDCLSHILEREIRSLLPDTKFQAYLRKSLGAAETHIKNSFHCKTPDCYGWCEYDDGVNEFKCPVCEHTNCLTCKAIHENMNCKEYQQQLFSQSPSNKHAKKTRKLLKKLVKKKEAMHCPGCNIIILKKEGCDWLRCSMCSLEICWVTKMPRWGPDGYGDTSDGCHCRENGLKCHPQCVNCH